MWIVITQSLQGAFGLRDLHWSHVNLEAANENG